MGIVSKVIAMGIVSKATIMDTDKIKEAPDGAVIKVPAVSINEPKDALDGGARKAPALDGDAALDAPGSSTSATISTGVTPCK